MQYVVVTGPLGSGKSLFIRYLIDALFKRGYTVHEDSFDVPIKSFMSIALGEPYEAMNRARPRAEFRGKSVAEFEHDVMRLYIPDTYGDDFFGRLLAHRTLGTSVDFVVIESHDPASNIDALPNSFVIYIKRRGHEFKDRANYEPSVPDVFILNAEKAQPNLEKWANKFADDLDNMVKAQ